MDSATTLTCDACGANYPVFDGTPVLINDDNSVFAIADFSASKSYIGASYGSARSGSLFRRAFRKAIVSLGEVHVGTGGFDTRSAIDAICRVRSNPRILVIGAGEVRYDAPADFTYTDVSLLAGAHAVCDAHDLPFEDASFDLVLAVAVLECVADPPRVAAEIWRVLKPDGHVFAATPFVQPVHMGAHDFTRYTDLGHRRLFRHFEEVGRGMSLGPGTGAALVMKALLLSLSDARPLRLLAYPLGLVLTLPLKLLDYLTRHTRSAVDGASAVFFFGRKANAPLSDRALITGYRGGFGAGSRLTGPGGTRAPARQQPPSGRPIPGVDP